MQTPKSILLHLDNTARAVERIKLARQLAQVFDAEVTSLPYTLSALMRYPYAIEAAVEAVAILRELDTQSRDKMHATFMAHSAGAPRLHWVEPQTEGLWGFARCALYADLMILGQRDPGDPMDSELPGDFLPSVLVQSGRPALVLPYVGLVGPIGQNVLVAWKETPESARAVGAALPWLLKADGVHLVSGFINHAAFDAAGIPDRCVANPRHSGLWLWFAPCARGASSLSVLTQIHETRH